MTRPQKLTKIETVRQMLTAPKGASLAQICAATRWQAHSVRAAISGLRKAGFVIERGAATEIGGGPVYQIFASSIAVEEVQWSQFSPSRVSLQ
ncbi:MAG: hypothetical protein JWS10_3073 [Cypionkella sp.]|uniref:DUF3489 domain-containing protein n=1 Tax=Cypionkella sp. TaxID=2811411 RepID=UPI0026108174|nr:DUF3489 domain-containing protein [Cypionkella sp.]MDB5660458.1 hypothetical protein [Cypionkella sp.]